MTALSKRQDQAGAKRAFSVFVPLSKIDADQRMVYGYASTEMRDAEGETITLDALRNALPGYLRFSNLREMHQLSAVGVTKEAAIDAKGLFIGGKIVDNGAWEKVKGDVYKGFSIGGTVTSRDPKDDSIITGLDLIEISLVDRPANPDCLIDLWKAERDGRRPVQKWDCGIAGHDHLQKADAAACIGTQSLGEGSTALLRSRLIKVVDSLTPEGLQATVAALEKGSKMTDKAEGDDVETDEKEAAAAADATKTTDVAKPEDLPTPGDMVSFTNDKYIQKGPGNATVISVEGGKVKIDHAGGSVDELDWSSLGEPELNINDGGDRIWLIKSEAADVTGQPGSCLITMISKAGEPTTITGRWVDLEKTAAPAKEEPEPKPAPKAEATAKAASGDYGADAEAGYADPGLQADAKPRLPLKEAGAYSAPRIRAGWNYLTKAVNAKAYSAEQLADIRGRISTAWKAAINPEGPPGEKETDKVITKAKDLPTMDPDNIGKLPDARASFQKGLIAAACAINLLDGMSDLVRRLKSERAMEGDGSEMPERMMAVVSMFSDVCQSLLEEEVEEMLMNKDLGGMDYPTAACAPSHFYYAQPVVDLAKAPKARVGKMLDAFTKTVGDRTGAPNYDNLTKAFEALLQKGQDEWSQAHPKDNEGDNDSWGASRPKDDQGSGDAWPKQVKRAAMTIRDQAQKMIMVINEASGEADAVEDEQKPDAKEKPKKPAVGEEKKDPPKPAAEAETEKKKAKAAKEFPPKKDEEEVEGEEEDPDAEEEMAEKKAKKAKAATATESKFQKSIDVLQATIAGLSERLAGRDPPKPSRTAVVGKAEDVPAYEIDESSGKLKTIVDPRNATDEQRDQVLRAVRSRPMFLQR
jgi:phage head maturation protease